MKITCKKSEILNSVNISLKAVPAKSTMPILECIIIEATDSTIKFITNDMELGIETIVNGLITATGSVAINAKIFSDIIRKLPDNDVVIETDANYMTTISCEKSVFTIAGKSSEEFPVLPKIVKKEPLILSQFSLKEIIRQTVFSISDNESNKIMTGELFEITGNEFKVVSLDGLRISIRKIFLKEEYKTTKVIVPGKTLNEISKILSGELENEVCIYFSERHILFEFDNTIVLSRLIEGEYFQIDQMLSSDYDTKIEIYRQEFISCIDRATLLVRESDKMPVIMNIADTGMNIQITTPLGSMDESMGVIKTGKDIVIGFNPRLLLDALRVIDDESVTLYFVNAKAPCFIRDDKNTYIYLILPVNISR